MAPQSTARLGAQEEWVAIARKAAAACQLRVEARPTRAAAGPAGQAAMVSHQTPGRAVERALRAALLFQILLQHIPMQLVAQRQEVPLERAARQAVRVLLEKFSLSNTTIRKK